MTLTDEKRAYIYRIWGEEQGEEMLADLDKAGKALAEAGAAFKSFVSDPREDTAGETQAVKDATDRADASFTQLAGDLIAGQAEALEGVAHIAKEQNALREKTGERFEAFEARITKAVDELRAEMQLRPRKATEAKETALKPESEIAQQVRKDIDEQNTAIDPFWGTKTSKEG